MVKMLLDGGGQLHKEDEEGRTPLHWAVLRSLHFRTESKEMVQLLLERGAEPHKTDKWGRTPLQLATEEGYKDVVQLLQKQTTAKEEEREKTQASNQFD